MTANWNASALFVIAVLVLTGAILAATYLVLPLNAWLQRRENPEVTRLDNARDVTGRTEL